ASNAADLPAGVPADQFQVNDEGLLVWVGSGSWRDGGWGTTSEALGGTEYRWGIPFMVIDSTGSNAITRIGDSNPDFHLGLSNTVQWRGLSLYGLFDMQFGGDVYNRP